jgi:hypothetical protein
MSEKILFSLKQCCKCDKAKDLIKNRDDINIIDLSPDVSMWTDEQKKLIEDHDVLNDLARTAPILWVDGEKKIGYLHIKQWFESLE